MKKVLKVTGIVILAVIIMTVGGCAALLGIANYKNENYYKYAEPQGEIEKKYTPLGSYEVSYAEFDAGTDTYKKYEVWYPADMKNGNETYPLVVMANGTGIKASQYKEVFKHLASWGFIVVGNEDENSRTGASSAATLDYMLGLNVDKNSDFYGKIDTANIGIGGHSQGGVGAINAVTEQENGNLYKAIFTASATSRYHADGLNKSGEGWSIAPSEINIPIFMVAGTGFADAGNMTEYSATLPEGSAQGICLLWWLEECYDTIPDITDKVTARLTGKDHGDMLRGADAYMTAWFMYYLKGDTEAGNVFFGKNAEILTNPLYQNQKSNRQQ